MTHNDVTTMTQTGIIELKKFIKNIPFIGPHIKAFALATQQFFRNRMIFLLLNYLQRRVKLFGALNKIFFYLYIKGVEYYQPLYGLAIKDRKPQRDCLDRADAVFHKIKSWGQGGHILDVGCSLGYFAHYFNERGYSVDGIDSNKNNIAVCNAVKRINKSSIHFSTAILNDQFVKQLETGKYDFVFLFSVLHHVAYYNGLEYAQNLMVNLLEKVPFIFVELAIKQEETLFDWRDVIPENELDFFAKCKNITIEKIGTFPNHLSPIWRPLYLIKNNRQLLCGEERTVIAHRFTGHYGANYFGRHYYDCGDTFIKKYLLANCKDNYAQIQHEINHYQQLPENAFFPRLLAHQQHEKFIEMALSKLPGENVHELLIAEKRLPIHTIFHTVIQALTLLHKHGIYHNDIRLWNILFDGEKTYLIDLGLARAEEVESTNLALLWLIKQLHQFTYHHFPYPLTTKPVWEGVTLTAPFEPIVKILQSNCSFKDFLIEYNKSI